MDKKFVAIDLFCGIGGLTHGLIKAGIDVRAGIDNDVTCKFAYEDNNDSKFIESDIKNIKGKDLEKYYRGADVKILVGCAPCQTFSTHSIKIRKNKNLKEDIRWSLLKEFSRLVSELKPDIVSMENVPLLEKQKVFSNFKNSLLKLGYDVKYKIINCSKYGMPQKRRRLVLLASRIGEIDIPEANNKKKSVRDVIADLPRVLPGRVNKKDPLHVAPSLTLINIERIKYSKPGGTWRDWPKKLRVNCHKKNSGSTYSSVYGRMAWDKPSPTITTQFNRYGTGRFGHPVQNRALTLREGAILQTFPKKYRFFKDINNISKTQIGIHIGNAVPVELGRIVGKAIIKTFRVSYA